MGELKKNPRVIQKLGDVLKQSYEEHYGEPLDLDPPEILDSEDDVPFNEEPTPGMEDVVHHWENAQ